VRVLVRRVYYSLVVASLGDGLHRPLVVQLWLEEPAVLYAQSFWLWDGCGYRPKLALE
jgi:hypothetical protein